MALLERTQRRTRASCEPSIAEQLLFEMSVTCQIVSRVGKLTIRKVKEVQTLVRRRFLEALQPNVRSPLCMASVLVV